MRLATLKPMNTLTQALEAMKGVCGIYRMTNTQKAFCDSLGVSYGAGTRLVRHKGVTVCGWRLAGTEDRLTNASRDTGAPVRRNAGRVHRLIGRDGDLVEGKRIDLAKHFGIGIASASSTLTALGSGKLKHYRGYTLIPAEAAQLAHR